MRDRRWTLTRRDRDPVCVCVSGPYGAAAGEARRGPAETESAGAALHQGLGEAGGGAARSAELQCVHRSRSVQAHAFVFRSHDRVVRFTPSYVCNDACVQITSVL